MTENEDPEKKGGVWALDQQLDQPMDEEAKKFSNMSEDKVLCLSHPLLILP